jgi:hypothetical protein
MAVRTNVSSYFSLRRILIQIHLDLFKIDRKILYAPLPEPLTDFEILVLILEDRRFFKHYGIDLRSVVRELVRALTFQRFGGARCNWSALLPATGSRHCAGSCTKCFSHGLFNTGTTNLKFCGRILSVPFMALISLGSSPPPETYLAFGHSSYLSTSPQNLPRCWSTRAL